MYTQAYRTRGIAVIQTFFLGRVCIKPQLNSTTLCKWAMGLEKFYANSQTYLEVLSVNQMFYVYI